MHILFFLFTVVPVVELMLLIQIGTYLGATTTILIVIFTGILGAFLARLEGISTIYKIQNCLARGEMPGHEIINGIFILIGAAFLITPGVMTDVLGLSMLFPLSRNLYSHLLFSHFKKKFKRQFNVIEIERVGDRNI